MPKNLEDLSPGIILGWVGEAVREKCCPYTCRFVKAASAVVEVGDLIMPEASHFGGCKKMPDHSEYNSTL